MGNSASKSSKTTKHSKHSKGKRGDAPPSYSFDDPALTGSDLQRLSLYDTVFVVDDSGSMTLPLDSTNIRTRWHQARDCLMKYSEIAARYDTDGIDIYFLNNTQYESQGLNTNMSSKTAIRDLFDAASPKGQTPIGTRLETLVGPYLAQIRDSKTKGQELPRPRNYIIITDGAATDSEVLLMILLKAAAFLEETNSPPTQLGFQFVQVGADSEATAFLEMLDGLLAREAANRDIVDTVKSSSRSKDDDDDLIKKILLGGINRYYDDRNVKS